MSHAVDFFAPAGVAVNHWTEGEMEFLALVVRTPDDISSNYLDGAGAEVRHVEAHGLQRREGIPTVVWERDVLLDEINHLY